MQSPVFVVVVCHWFAFLFTGVVPTVESVCMQKGERSIFNIFRDSFNSCQMMPMVRMNYEKHFNIFDMPHSTSHSCIAFPFPFAFSLLFKIHCFEIRFSLFNRACLNCFSPFYCSYSHVCPFVVITPVCYHDYVLANFFSFRFPTLCSFSFSYILFGVANFYLGFAVYVRCEHTCVFWFCLTEREKKNTF